MFTWNRIVIYSEHIGIILKEWHEIRLDNSSYFLDKQHRLNFDVLAGWENDYNKCSDTENAVQNLLNIKNIWYSHNF